MFAALIGSALAVCTLPANPFSTTCATGSIADAATCVVRCMKYYVPTAVPTYTCTGTTLAPTRIACIPDQKFARMFPWRVSKCAVLEDDTVFAGSTTTAGAATASAGVITLQTTSTLFWGEWQFKPVRTFGRRQPIEIMFDYKLEGAATGLGSRGIFLVVSQSSPSISGAAGTTLGTGALLGLELDLDPSSAGDVGASSLNADFGSSHIAVLYSDELHTSMAQASLATLAASNAFTWSMTGYKSVSVVLKPVQSSDSVLVELWHGGMLIARDTITKAGAANANLVTMIDQPRRFFVAIYGDADMTNNGVVKIQNAKFCGAELPRLWHKYFVPATGVRTRLCIVTESFGNPEPTIPGLWRPSACPAGIALWPMAPMANSLTM